MDINILLVAASFLGAALGSVVTVYHTYKINAINALRNRIAEMGEHFRIYETNDKTNTTILREGVEAFHCYCQCMMTNTEVEKKYRYIISGYLNSVREYIHSFELTKIRDEWFIFWRATSIPQKVVLYAYVDYVFDQDLTQMIGNIKHDMLSELVHDIAFFAQPCYEYISRTKWI